MMSVTRHAHTWVLCWVCVANFGAQGNCRGGFCEKLWKLPPCPVGPKPPEPLLAKAEPTSGSGTFGITELRTKKLIDRGCWSQRREV